MASPEPRKKARRSTDLLAASDRIPDRWGRRATPLVFFLNIFLLPSWLRLIAGLLGFIKSASGRHATVGRRKHRPV